MIERQTIVTWFTPEEKLPPEDVGVLATVTAKGGNKEFIRAIITAYYCKDEGWYELDYGFSEIKSWQIWRAKNEGLNKLFTKRA